MLFSQAGSWVFWPCSQLWVLCCSGFRCCWISTNRVCCVIVVVTSCGDPVNCSSKEQWGVSAEMWPSAESQERSLVLNQGTRAHYRTSNWLVWNSRDELIHTLGQSKALYKEQGWGHMGAKQELVLDTLLVTDNDLWHRRQQQRTARSRSFSPPLLFVVVSVCSSWKWRVSCTIDATRSNIRNLCGISNVVGMITRNVPKDHEPIWVPCLCCGFQALCVLKLLVPLSHTKLHASPP